MTSRTSAARQRRACRPRSSSSRCSSREFDVAYEEGGLFILTMHPHITGHRSRVAGLEQLIAYMKSKPGVWFATHEQIARYVQQQMKTGSAQ